MLEIEQIDFGGHMVAVMALMEAPSIIVGLLLISIYDKDNAIKISMSLLINPYTIFYTFSKCDRYFKAKASLTSFLSCFLPLTRFSLLFMAFPTSSLK